MERGCASHLRNKCLGIFRRILTSDFMSFKLHAFMVVASFRAFKKSRIVRVSLFQLFLNFEVCEPKGAPVQFLAPKYTRKFTRFLIDWSRLIEVVVRKSRSWMMKFANWPYDFLWFRNHQDTRVSALKSKLLKFTPAEGRFYLPTFNSLKTSAATRKMAANTEPISK